MNTKKWLKENKIFFENKTICITGSTGGLAQAFIDSLSELAINFIFVNRDVEKTEQQKKALLEKHPQIKIDIIQADMLDIDSVKTAAQKLALLKFDYLILNAAVYNVPLKTSSIGSNNVFQINFISPYYLTKTLLPVINKNKTKVIVVGSIAHNFSQINLNDLDFTKNAKPSKIYGNSKRFLMFSLFKLFQFNNKEQLCMVHPGVTYTNMTSHYPKCINWFVKPCVKLFFPNTKSACKSLIFALKNNTEYLEWIGPKFINVWGGPKKSKLKSCSEKECEKIFQIANEIYLQISNK